jgi:hypothetical protein
MFVVKDATIGLWTNVVQNNVVQTMYHVECHHKNNSGIQQLTYLHLNWDPLSRHDSIDKKYGPIW